jgi:hypothetical protein
MALSCFFQKKMIDLTLRKGMVTPLFSNINQAGLRADMTEQFITGQMVIDNHVRSFKTSHPLKGNKSRITRA